MAAAVSSVACIGVVACFPDIPPADGTAASTGAGGGSAAYVDAVRADRPVAYWRLDDRAGSIVRDLSDSAIEGTYGSNVLLGADSLLVSDPSDSAVAFPGGTSVTPENLVRVPPNAKLRPTQQLTVECWIRISSQATTQWLVSYGADFTAPYENYILQLVTVTQSNGTKVSGVPQFYAIIDGAPHAATAAASSHLPVGAPIYLVATYDGTSFEIFVDGTPAAQPAPVSGSLGPYDLSNGLGIGSVYSATRPAFAGIVDEVAIYDSALTAERISAHYLAGSTP